jgi:heme/copper-type cytochrome/quinol oxidase subunit 3
MLFGVIVFGLIFLGCQVYEFTHFVRGYGLTLSSNIFGSTFFVLTGTHGVHVTLGVMWLIGWLIYSFTGKMGPEHAMDIEVAGLYWHFVDIVWVIIFPVVYLAEYIL